MEMIKKFTDKINELSDKLTAYKNETKITDEVYNTILDAVAKVPNKEDYGELDVEVVALASIGTEKVFEIINKLNIDIDPDYVDTIIRILNNKVFAENKSKRYMSAFEDLKVILNTIEAIIRTNASNEEYYALMNQKLNVLKKYQHYFGKDSLVEPMYKIKEFADVLNDPFYEFGYSEEDIIEIVTQISINNVTLSKETENRYIEEYNRDLEERLASITGIDEEPIIEDNTVEEESEEVIEETPLELTTISKPQEMNSKVNIDLINDFDLYEQIRTIVKDELYKIDIGNSSRYYISRDFAKNFKDNGISIEDIKELLTMPKHFEAFLLYVMRLYCNEIDEWLNDIIPEKDHEEYAELINDYVTSLIDFYNKYYVSYMNEKNPDIPEGNPKELETSKTSKTLLVKDSRGNVTFIESLKKLNLSYEDVANALKNIEENPKLQNVILSNGVPTKNRFRMLGNYNIIYFPYEGYVIIYDILSKNEFDKSRHEYGDVFKKSIELIKNGGQDLRKEIDEDQNLLKSVSHVRGGDNNE